MHIMGGGSRNGLKAAPEKHLEGSTGSPALLPGAEVSGLILPFKVAESFNGKPVASPVMTYESVRINQPSN